ncbi:ATP-dependent endonuclease, partial [Actinotalea sp. AC32]|nr:ATP-dependent endonuclease [Actinotalea sp. AC32]
TSHSPYVIEQFEPGDIVPLHRRGDELIGSPIDATAIKAKTYRTESRQFAEAILSRAVLIVEGATELVVFSAASNALERLGRPGYTHIDLSGVSLFNAKNDSTVKKFAPVFKSMNKRVYGVWDRPRGTDTATAVQGADDSADLPTAAFDRFWESPETGIERVLVKQTSTAVLRRFLDDVATREDYPRSIVYTAATPDDDLESVACEVLKARKGDNWPYVELLFDKMETIDEIPRFVRDVLLAIDADLAMAPEEPAGMGSDDAPAAEKAGSEISSEEERALPVDPGV